MMFTDPVNRARMVRWESAARQCSASSAPRPGDIPATALH